MMMMMKTDGDGYDGDGDGEDVDDGDDLALPPSLVGGRSYSVNWLLGGHWSLVRSDTSCRIINYISLTLYLLIVYQGFFQVVNFENHFWG